MWKWSWPNFELICRNLQQKQEDDHEKPVSMALTSTTNSMWSAMGMNSGPRDKKLRQTACVHISITLQIRVNCTRSKW